jgi:hypothetical protein
VAIFQKFLVFFQEIRRLWRAKNLDKNLIDRQNSIFVVVVVGDRAKERRRRRWITVDDIGLIIGFL